MCLTICMDMFVMITVSVMLVILFQGPGMIVSHEKKEIIRSHYDLEKDTCKYHKKAAKVKVESNLYESRVCVYSCSYSH